MVETVTPVTELGDGALRIPIRRVRSAKDGQVPLPRYMSCRAAGMDLFADLDEPLTLEPQEIVLVPTGVAVALPEGFEAQIRARSGLACSHGIGVINAPGTIDADYRGEIKVGLVNLGSRPFTIRRGDRIAQMVIARVYRACWEPQETLPETERNDGGFGHTGR